MAQTKNAKVKEEENVQQIPSPKQICEYLDQYVIGQEDAKKVLSVAIYNHVKRAMANIGGLSPNKELEDVIIEKSNVLITGHSGTGKTFLVKTIAKYLNIPCYIADSTKLTESGYVGDDVENVLVGLLRAADGNVALAQMGIVVLDEFDKLGRKGDNPSITRDVGGEGVQQGLLKIVEGGIVGVPPQGGRKHPEQELIEIDTSNILFIALGAFDGLDDIVEHRTQKKSVGFNSLVRGNDEHEKVNPLSKVMSSDLKSFGIIPELIGRMPVIAYTNDLTEDDLVRIMKEPKNALIKQYQKLMLIDGVDLTFNDEACKIIANYALNLKIGARGLRSIMEKVLTNIMYDYSGENNGIKKVEIDADYVSGILDIENKKAA